MRVRGGVALQRRAEAPADASLADPPKVPPSEAQPKEIPLAPSTNNEKKQCARVWWGGAPAPRGGSSRRQPHGPSKGPAKRSPAQRNPPRPLNQQREEAVCACVVGWRSSAARRLQPTPASRTLQRSRKAKPSPKRYPSSLNQQREEAVCACVVGRRSSAARRLQPTPASRTLQRSRQAKPSPKKSPSPPQPTTRRSSVRACGGAARCGEVALQRPCPLMPECQAGTYCAEPVARRPGHISGRHRGRCGTARAARRTSRK